VKGKEGRGRLGGRNACEENDEYEETKAGVTKDLVVAASEKDQARIQKGGQRMS